MGNILRWLRSILLGGEKRPDLEEAHYPRNATGAPDLTCFTRPVEYYARYIHDYLESLESPRGAPPRAPEWQVYEYQKYVLGQWGLIARGASEALPTSCDSCATASPKGGRRHRECSTHGRTAEPR